MRLLSKSPCFSRHVEAHELILEDRSWYADGPPFLGWPFTAERTADRQEELIAILLRAAKRERTQGALYEARRCEALSDKLDWCSWRHRCGSMACQKCARAFQRAKVNMQLALIDRQSKEDGKPVFVTVVPIEHKWRYGSLDTVSPTNFNRVLKDRMTRAGLNLVFCGSLDLSLEDDFVQPHWHFVTRTNDRKKLQKGLREIFPKLNKGDRPVVIRDPDDHGYVPYVYKVIEINELLRTRRCRLPQLLLLLDRIEPFDTLVLSGVRLQVRHEEIRLRLIGQGTSKAVVSSKAVKIAASVF